MARPKKIRTITSAEVLEFLETAKPEMLEILSELIRKKIMQLRGSSRSNN
jgi:hypothetical protein